MAARGALERTEVPSDVIRDVAMGCVGRVGLDADNVRRVAMAAGAAAGVPAYSVNCLRGSGLQAIWSAALVILPAPFHHIHMEVPPRTWPRGATSHALGRMSSRSAEGGDARGQGSLRGEIVPHDHCGRAAAMVSNRVSARLCPGAREAGMDVH